MRNDAYSKQVIKALHGSCMSQDFYINNTSSF